MLEKESTQSLGISPIDVTFNFDEMSLQHGFSTTWGGQNPKLVKWSVQEDFTNWTPIDAGSITPFKIGDFDKVSLLDVINDPVNNPAHHNTDVTFKTVTDDPVNNPAHYNHKGVEAIAAIEASMTDEEFQGYLKGNCMKYLWRYKYKGKPVEDLKKAQWYLEKLIASVDNV
jgi:hypothetical protein